MTQVPETRDSLLVRLANAADHEAWLAFTAIYRPLIYRIARRRGLQDADAQDLAQRVLCSVAGAIGGWQSTPRRARFRTWLHTVARNAVIDHLRAAAPDMPAGGTTALMRLHAAADSRLNPADVDREYQRELLRWAAKEIRGEFEEATWLAFSLTAIEQRAIPAVADELGKSVGAVYIARSRVMQRLREKVRGVRRRDERSPVKPGRPAMSIDSKSCDSARIARLLCGKLSEQEHDALAEHLNGCLACSTSLQAETAGPSWWQAAAEFLADDPCELEPLSQPASGEDRPIASPAVRQVLNHRAPSDDPRMLGRIGGYEVLGVVGSGGMGVVLKALDPALNRYVAIKTLSPTLAASGAARQRFAREARAAAAVVHHNVSEIYGVAEMDGLPYLVMPYVRGQSLQRRLDECGPLAVAEILRIGMQTSAGLAAAHGQGIVHRDIKPANILLSEGIDRVQITDFGLARAADDASLTHSGMIAGTPQYMSPEQARGESIDQRSDLFSLGSVLYAMCTGRAPFRAETSYGVLRRITDSPPRPIRELNPDIPIWLCRLIGKLHALSPEDRYQSAEEVSQLLGRCLAHVQQPDAHALPEELVETSSRPWLSRFTPLHGAFAMIAALGIGLMGMFLWQATSPPEISGRWRGDQWGLVTLTQTQPNNYMGTYSDTFGKQPGELQLKWSRIEQRFNGTWREGKERFGELSIRLVGDDIRGAWTTDDKSQIEPARPRLADLLWIRVPGETTKEVSTPVTAPLTPRDPAVRELHVVSIYEGNVRTGTTIHGERATVRVDRPGKSVVLFLGAYGSVTWDVAAAKDTRVESIILGGHKKQVIPQRLRVRRSWKHWLRTEPGLRDTTGSTRAQLAGSSGN